MAYAFNDDRSKGKIKKVIIKLLNDVEISYYQSTSINLTRIMQRDGYSEILPKYDDIELLGILSYRIQARYRVDEWDPVIITRIEPKEGEDGDLNVLMNVKNYSGSVITIPKNQCWVAFTYIEK